MRLYDIVSGIILILSIIDFAVAAPVLVQEKRQACVDVVHIPRDSITVLGKRGFGEELDKFAQLVKASFKTWDPVNQVKSSEAHASSSSAPPGPDLGSTNVVQAPVPNPASSTTHLNPLTGPSDPSSTVLESSANPNPLTEPWDPSSIAYSPPNPSTEPWDPSSIAFESPNRLLESWDPSSIASESSANPNPLMEPASPSSKAFDSASLSDSSEYETSHEFEGGNSDESHGPLYTQTSSGYGLDHELTEAHAPQSDPKKRPWTDPDGPGPYFDWNYWIDLEDPPPKKLALSKEFGQANEYQVEHLQQPDPGPPTDFDSNYYPVLDPVHPPFASAGLPTEPEYNVFHGQPPNPELTDPYHLDHQSSSTDSQPVDPQAAIYATKGSAKESRRISRTARDVGNTAQRELQPDERSLDPRE